MISLGDNSEDETEADEITNASKNIQYYIDNIADADYLETDTLNGLLISALLSINHILDCLRGKLSVIAALIQDCLAGNGDMESIYADAKALEKKKVNDECITNGYFTYEDIVNVTAEAMILNNASTVCFRNNPLKQLLVCGDWYDNIDNATMAITHNITMDDANYFITLLSQLISQIQLLHKFVVKRRMKKLAIKFPQHILNLILYKFSPHMMNAT